jgi:tetratricopeptide (TPR) repeat protein
MVIATQQQNDRLKALAMAGGWAILFLAAIFAYWPGLGGPFVFDDFGSIAALGDRGGVTDWDTFKAFVFGGQAGPTGRPLALLSFLIDANNWPADPWRFKRTNLVIHLVNGALLGVLTARILRLLRFGNRDARWIALVSTACWLLHPFLISTTLYAVQRMAQLSTLFIFAGLITYLYGRSFLANNAMKAYLIMSASLGLFTFLATISKENGILLPLLAGVIEITIVASQQPRLMPLNRYWGIVFIVVPSTVIVIYLGTRIMSDGFFVVAPPRDFSTYERLLTEPRVLVDYLKHWFMPELYTTGVFQDHFTKSTGFFAPITTAPSALLHIAVLLISIVKRRQWPLFAFAALFFYGSHVLESSVLKLELYFEHRNYLAAAFLFLPLLVLLQKKVSRQLFFVVAVCAMLLLGGFTRYSATIWADYSSMVEASARKAPTSARAQAGYATQLYNADRYGESLQVIGKAIQNIPNSSYLEITRTTLRCNMGDLTARDFEQATGLVSARTFDPRMFELYTTLVSSVIGKQCPDISTDAVRDLFANMLLVPQNADPQSLRYSQIKYFIGFVDAYDGKPSQAVSAFEESLRARPGASHAMLMAAHLATGEYFDEALHFSDLALSQLDAESRHVLQGNRVGANDIRQFQAVVRADKEAARKEESVRRRPQ